MRGGRILLEGERQVVLMEEGREDIRVVKDTFVSVRGLVMACGTDSGAGGGNAGFFVVVVVVAR